LSALIGAGAVGKTGIRIAQALAVATGRELTGEKVWAKCPVLFVCMEDDEAELRRRFRAATKFFGIERSELQDMLIWSVKGERLATLTQQGTMRETNLYGDLAKVIKENGVGLVVLDPFVKVHEVNENDNAAVDSVVTLLITLAEKRDIAVDILHHRQEGADPSRGCRRCARGQRADQWRPAFPHRDADDRRRGQEIRHRRPRP
jgi:RecA-family ATPase